MVVNVSPVDAHCCYGAGKNLPEAILANFLAMDTSYTCVVIDWHVKTAVALKNKILVFFPADGHPIIEVNGRFF